jgi:hypothetical protein
MTEWADGFTWPPSKHQTPMRLNIEDLSTQGHQLILPKERQILLRPEASTLGFPAPLRDGFRIVALWVEYHCEGSCSPQTPSSSTGSDGQG